MGGFWRELASASQLRWVGPEKGVIHLATAAIVNARLGSLGQARGQAGLAAGRRHDAGAVRRPHRFPLPDRCADAATRRWRSCSANEPAKAKRIAELEAKGFPAYTTSAGWLGYSDDKMRRLCREAIADGMDHIKIKVGRDLDDDKRRCAIVREEIGPDRFLMIDANQIWDVDQAIDWVTAAGALSSALDRGADQPRRRAGPCRHPQGGEAARHRGRDRRDVPEPRHLQAAHAGAAPSTSARSIPAGWAASTRSWRCC